MKLSIALVGYGQMGQSIHQLADSMNCEVLRIIDPTSTEATHTSVSEESMSGVDVAIDFSAPQCAVANMRRLAELGVPCVVGTTGWNADFQEVESFVNDAGVGLIYAENFSLGVQAYLSIAEEAAKRYGALPGYDVSGFEIHHSKKVDSPSGTGRKLAETLAQAMSSKESITYEKIDRRPDPSELHFSSLRCGSVPGTHTVLFSSPDDTITLTHQAHGREAWAKGALAAAAWIYKRRGMFHVRSMIEEEAPCTVS